VTVRTWLVAGVATFATLAVAPAAEAQQPSAPPCAEGSPSALQFEGLPSRIPFGREETFSLDYADYDWDVVSAIEITMRSGSDEFFHDTTSDEFADLYLELDLGTRRPPSRLRSSSPRAALTRPRAACARSRRELADIDTCSPLIAATNRAIDRTQSSSPAAMATTASAGCVGEAGTDALHMRGARRTRTTASILRCRALPSLSSPGPRFTTSNVERCWLRLHAFTCCVSGSTS
jgi:hypothetical protein